ncbi:hypothetical protein BJ322DRAFT_801842 [Thelephora terrestris]|uniref:Uncharacterized protein n=1 Tax=Thelephora terrestris TaxID=56493 RepID=A0A9P6HDL7_9AGAM|nr:hypothetical protein BJ322DRAFT_801842 [Thelephora terrestris]
MDDLYGNAWGDPLNNYSSQPYPLPTWSTQVSSPKPQSPVEDDQNDPHVSDDEREDLTAETESRAGASDASWTADAIPWPVEENEGIFNSAWVSPKSVWSPAEQPQTTSAPGVSDDISHISLPLASPTLSEEPNEDYTTPSEQAQDTPVQSRAHSPDQFGTFESGTADATNSTEGGWGSPKYSRFDESVDPPNAWGQQDTAKAQDAEPVDEWEAARQMKEKVDRRVPPEVIASIIETFDQFSETMWQGRPSSDSQVQEEWLQNWRRGFDGVEGLNTVIDALLPEYTFAPRVPFAKSATAKEMNRSLRLTRHSSITRLSPMAHFMLSKGSSSDWEAAVKNRSDEIPDDMPIGWRIVERKEEASAPVEAKKRSSLFSSFWTRREGSTTSISSIPDTKAPPAQDSPTESSPTNSSFTAKRAATPPIVPLRTTSRSPSQSSEGQRSQSVSSNTPTKPPSVPPVITASFSASSTNTASSATSSPVDSITTTDGPAQSAVSRFLNRFSRPKSTASNSSIPLSSEDLDFLSDVPVVNGTSQIGDEDDDMPLWKQKAMMESKQGAVLPTPLTATPLRAGTPNRPPPQTVAEDDFDALFNAPIVQPQKIPLQTPSRPSSSVSQRGTFPPPSTPPQTETPRSFTIPLRPHTPSFPIVRMSAKSSTSSSGPVPFLIPPPPSTPSRSPTPQPSSRTVSPPIAASIPTLLPPPRLKPPEATLFDDDDDEFSDFLSSSQRPPVANGTKHPNAPSFSDPMKAIGLFDSSNSITSSTSQQPILHTSTGSTSSMASPVSDTADDAWGFGELEDSNSTAADSNHVSLIAGTPPTSTAVNQLSASQKWLSKPSPPPPPVPSKSGSSTPPSLTTSPLGPPPKPQPRQRLQPFNFPGPGKKQPPHSRSHSRRVSAEDHSHTIQLMNNASKRAAWPAPLSPLPEVLAPPPPPSSTVNSSITTPSSSKALLDINDDGPFSRAQEKSLPLNPAVSVIGPSEDGGGVSFSSTGSRGGGGFFSIPPPPGFTSRTSTAPPEPEQEQSLLDFGDFESPRTASIPKPTPPMGDKSGGGLSAQDLSFFEGF